MRLNILLESIRAKSITQTFSRIIDQSLSNSKTLASNTSKNQDVNPGKVMMYFWKRLPHLCRSYIGIDVRYIANTNAIGAVFKEVPNVILISNSFTSYVTNQYIKNPELNTIKQLLIEPLVHEYTHVLQDAQYSEQNYTQSKYVEIPAEIDAFVNGWYSFVNKEVGDKFNANRMVQAVKQCFNQFENDENKFENLSPNVRKKYLKRMYIALVSNHDFDYLEQLKINDPVYIIDTFQIDKPLSATVVDLTSLDKHNDVGVKIDNIDDVVFVSRDMITKKFIKKNVSNTLGIGIDDVVSYMNSNRDDFLS